MSDDLDPKVLKSHKKFNSDVLVEGVDYVECKVCKQRVAGTLARHVKLAHKYDSTDEYINEFNLKPSDMVSEQYRNKQRNAVLGDKNPGYQHGGKLSPWSDKSEYHSKEQIKASKRKAIDNMTPDKRDTCIEYYLAKGFDMLEAKKKLAERQRTFSKDICIAKYGDAGGLARFKERQDKWQNSLVNLPPAVIENINNGKANRMSVNNPTGREYYDKQGYFYIIHLNNDMIKIGVSIRPVEQRYTALVLKCKDYIEYPYNVVYDAFKIEQMLLAMFKQHVITKDQQYEDFGFTETFHGLDYDEVILCKDMVSDKIKGGLL